MANTFRSSNVCGPRGALDAIFILSDGWPMDSVVEFCFDSDADGIAYDVLCDPSTAIQFFVGPVNLTRYFHFQEMQ